MKICKKCYEPLSEVVASKSGNGRMQKSTSCYLRLNTWRRI